MRTFCTAMLAQRATCAAALVIAASAPAADIVVTMDMITFDEKTQRYSGPDGKPFKAAFAEGLAAENDKVLISKFRSEQFTGFLDIQKMTKPDGLVFFNDADGAITDFHLKLTGDDRFKATDHMGGGAYPMVMVSDDGKEIWFTGGNLPKRDIDNPGTTTPYIWLKIERGAQNMFKGQITPDKPKKPDKKEKENGPCAGNDGSGQRGSLPTVTFDATSSTISFSSTSVNFVKYGDGSIAGPDETMLGAPMLLGDMLITGSSPDVPGAFRLGDSSVRFAGPSEHDFLSATLTQGIIVPDDSVPGYDTLIQATLVWELASPDLGSPFIRESYTTASTPDPMLVFFRSNLLTHSGGLSESATDFGRVFVSVPAPGTAVGIVLILAAKMARLRRRGPIAMRMRMLSR